jgi:squalene-hopene/tetraprenyl-beta-curcumene cyclase
MSNTFMALEALYYSEYLTKEQGEASSKLGMKDLNWSAALAFIQRCQNLPSHNKEPWASDDPQNKGGFIYTPGQSMAGEVKLPSGRTALRSYGSISYAGLLSYVYAHLQRDDPRVVAVYEWLQKNYSLEENPGLGQQGLFYYYLTMAKALSIYGVDRLTLSDGKTILWREDLTKRLLNLQNAKGFWVNSNNRWWEKDPVLVTAYTIIALDYIARGM